MSYLSTPIQYRRGLMHTPVRGGRDHIITKHCKGHSPHSFTYTHTHTYSLPTPRKGYREGPRSLQFTSSTPHPRAALHAGQVNESPALHTWLMDPSSGAGLSLYTSVFCGGGCAAVAAAASRHTIFSAALILSPSSARLLHPLSAPFTAAHCIPVLQ